MTKKFKLKAEDIKPLATGRGSCFGTDMITVRGKPVGFMYREASRTTRSTAAGGSCRGLEDQDYMDDPDNHGDLRCKHHREL